LLQHKKIIAIYALALTLIGVLYLIPPDFSFNALETHILLYLKLPVLLTAIVVGAAITAASACLQVILRNPLADPGIIGISSGASLVAAAFILLSGTSVGAILGINSLSSHAYMLPLMCFLGAFTSSVLIFVLAKWMGAAISSVILAGIAISTLCSAIVAWMFLVAPPNQLQSLTFWLMGSLNNTNWQTLLISAPMIFLALGLLLHSAKGLNQLYLGEQAAKLIGVNTKAFQTKMLLLVSVLVGISVSIAGSIAFLGLLVPHFVRRLHGNDNQLVVPISALSGACVLVICAFINGQLSTINLPVSVLTASIGAPLFIYVMLSTRPS